MALESGGTLTKRDTLALATIDLEKLLGVHGRHGHGDLVATTGGDLFDFSSKVVAVISPDRGTVDLL